MGNIDLIREVKNNAVNHWSSLLPACGVNVPERGKHGACPVCGGTDRFHFVDDHHNGNWFCRQCDEPNHGDGLDLIAKVKGVSVFEAAKEVSQALSLPLPEPAGQEAPKSAVQPIAEKVRKLVAQTTAGQSAYLTAKGHTCPVRMLEDGSLLLVIRCGDEVTGAQIIRPDGEKRLIAGTRKKGSFISVSELPETADTVLIAEGYATALTVAQLYDGLVLAAIDEGNLLPVTEWVAGRYPEAKIIIAADNDIKPGQPNVGKISAEKAVKSFHRGWVTLPPTEDKADWDDYRQQHGTEAAKQAFSKGLYQPQGEMVKPTLTIIEGKKGAKSAASTATPALNQMGASQRGEVLLARYDGALAIHGDSDTVHHYDGVIWKPVPDKELQREMAAIFIESEISYSQNGIKSAVDTMKLSLPLMGNTARNLIGFNNGVFDTKAGQFRPHRRDDWLLIASDVEFSQAQEGETLESHAPNFWKWLTRSTGGNNRKADRVLAALYMVMANRYDWQLFLEITGPGGSGKSVLAEICTMLAGKANTVSASMAALENPRERALVVGYSLIIMPDMSRYAGDGAGIKAITGGDKVAIDPKHKAPYSTRITAMPRDVTGLFYRSCYGRGIRSLKH